jgi:hypothetical protein
MSILKSLFGKKPITSTTIAAEIEKARAEHDAALAKRGAALAGLGLMDDAAHQHAEAEYEVHRRAIATVQGRNKLIITVGGRSLEAQQVRSTFEQSLSEIERYLGWQREMANPHNDSLRKNALRDIAARKEKLLAARSMAASITASASSPH